MFEHLGSTEIISDFPRGQVVLYLIKNEQNALIDTGPKETAEKDILPALKSKGMTLKDLDYIINTHGHFDHTGGNYAVKAGGNAKICIHELEKNQVANRKQYIEEFFRPVVASILGESHFDSEWEDYTQIAGPETGVDMIIWDNDLLRLGRGCELRVIHLPGHTPGSLGLYWENEGILFSGDSLPGLHDGQGGILILTDLDAYRKSIQRVRDLPLNYVMMSHKFRDSMNQASYCLAGKEIDIYLQICLKFIDCLQNAINGLELGMLEQPISNIYNKVISGLPAEMGFKYSEELGTNLFNSKTVLFELKKDSLQKINAI
jgi:glyoxylase-like metal-dependent hydrolase (beta-lactamase superfamily II)